ncbi:MAG: DNA polymerase/3'-5' exonuclease PolX, partial [Bacteroidota bacterium]
DIDILVSTRPTEAKKTMKLFTSHPEVERVLAEGETKSSVILKAGINCDLRVVSDRQFPFALHYFTGSKQHNIRMRSIAKDMDIKMNEYGLFKGKAEKFISCSDEEEIFETLGLVYVPPELREDMGEIEAAQKTKLPKLLEATDIRGAFHCHTSYSDGFNSVEEMSKAARDLGWEYLGIADHSKIAAYAGGLSVERVKQQHREIDRLNNRHSNFRIFKGTEVDILTDGSLDWSDKVLAMFDYAVASIHSKFKMSEAEATRRIIKAIKNDFVTMLGHPTGRLLLSRDGYPVNMVDVINAASDYGKIIEINAHPLRLDLDWRLCKYAKGKGVRVSINPDAHGIEGLRDVLYGVGIARKGWLEKRDVVNTRTLREVVKLLRLDN